MEIFLIYYRSQINNEMKVLTDDTNDPIRFLSLSNAFYIAREFRNSQPYDPTIEIENTKTKKRVSLAGKPTN